MRKVFLDNLPRWEESSRYKGKIKWKESVGYKVKFIYDEIKGEIEIIDFNNSILKIRYSDRLDSIHYNHFGKCKIGRILRKRSKFYKYDLGELIEQTFGTLEIINQIKISDKKIKGYEYKCLECGNTDEISEYCLKSGRGCNICSNRIIKRGFNDLFTTHYKTASMLKHKSRGYEISKGYKGKEVFICPDCGYEDSYYVSSVIRKFSCSKCADFISYPEKFAYSALEQLEINFERQKIFSWSNNKRYDFYIPSLNLIIETHGIQHYESSFSFKKSKSRSLKEEKLNDLIKKKLALENGIKHYVVIDCRYSEPMYIIKSFLKCELNKLFDLSKINWILCHEFSCSSLVKQVIELWNNGCKNTSEIARILKIAKVTVIDYLKKGRELNLCNYDPKDELTKIGIMNGKKNSKKIVQLDKSMKIISKWSSMTEASKSLNINLKNISATCNQTNGYKSAGGFKWMYLKDYEKYIKEQNSEKLLT